MEFNEQFNELLPRIALALGIGLLIGLERGWRLREAESGSRAAGIRTFAISGLLGGIAAAIAALAGGIASPGGGIVLAASFATYAAVMASFSRDENRDAGNHSATTTVAGMLTFSLGAYAMIGDMRIAAATAVAGAVTLALRDQLHGWVAKITWPELRSGLALLAMTFIALPIMPTDPIGPFGGVNPRQVWIIAIVLASVSFIGYVAVKLLGAHRGVLVAAAAGGLVSSTAVTVANARRAAAGEASGRLLAAGVAIAAAISFLRVFTIAALIQPRLLAVMGPALIAATLTAIGFALSTSWRSTKLDQQPEVKFRNPFGFWSVVGFAIFLAAIIVLGRAVGENFGATGATIGAIVVGLVDVDSVTISLASLAPSSLGQIPAATAILAAVASDTVSKVAIGAALGHLRFAARLAVMTILCFAAAGAALGVTFALQLPELSP
jgi:uncharacterized membrane protein (DUF4010 family)